MKKKILVLEESRMVHDLIKSDDLIKRGDGSFFFCSKPEEFIKKAKAVLPALILLSNQDQKRDYKVLKAIRRTKGLKTVPVIILSCSNDKIETDLLKQLGVICIIRKPFQATTLQKWISKVIKPLKKETSQKLKTGKKGPRIDIKHPVQQPKDPQEKSDWLASAVEVSADEIGMRKIDSKAIKPTKLKNANVPVIKTKKSAVSKGGKEVRRENGKILKVKGEIKNNGNGKKGQEGRIDIFQRMAVARYTEFRRIVLPEGQWHSHNLNALQYYYHLPPST